MSDKAYITLLAAILVPVFMWSAIKPYDYFTWFLEVVPVLIAVPILAATYNRFRLTRLVYGLVVLHSIILIIGGHYTYALVPMGDWAREAFDLSRNHYDRIGHFAQGFIPAIVAREILLRLSPLKRGKWLFFIVVSICLAISAFYELIEWSVAEMTGTAADDFLGTQGDVWDSQKDMALALIGSIIAQITLAGVQDRQIQKLEER